MGGADITGSVEAHIRVAEIIGEDEQDVGSGVFTRTCRGSQKQNSEGENDESEAEFHGRVVEGPGPRAEARRHDGDDGELLTASAMGFQATEVQKRRTILQVRLSELESNWHVRLLKFRTARGRDGGA